MDGEQSDRAELLTRGVSEMIGKEDLVKRLDRGEKLRVKFGVDPTSPHLHIGRSVPLLKLRDFQRLGHTVVLIVGDFTGVIGDTSDKESERPMLSRATIEENMRTYVKQASSLLDMSEVEVHYNSEWLDTLTYREIGEHADRFSVADFIARENIKKRLDAGKRVSLREVLYPLMQGYDSVAVRADVEIGGSDQRFNLLAGRTLQAGYGQEPQVVIMNPLIAGLDGRKMSSSWGNTINLDDTPDNMYGRVMSLHDDLVPQYFALCTRVPLAEIKVLEEGLLHGTLHPRDAKMRLARELVALHHGREAAETAERSFVSTFQEGRIPEDMEQVHGASGSLIGDILHEAGIVPSRSAWRRLVLGGGVHMLEGDNEETLHDPGSVLEKELVLKVGKRRFVRIVVQ